MLEIKDTKDTQKSALYFDHYLEIDHENQLGSMLYNKSGDFIIFPYMYLWILKSLK